MSKPTLVNTSIELDIRVSFTAALPCELVNGFLSELAFGIHPEATGDFKERLVNNPSLLSGKNVKITVVRANRVDADGRRDMTHELSPLGDDSPD